ncbi:MAG: cupin domain-containing protein [Edaphobacter sp.]|uniref:cupin domain-containing protein n=1 Tax=Edaphobacter sp. TaxID=1934404 RepID=UPI00238A7ADB|nr:cupin domain-containing protein [Edaphobacter sp.]MDE1178541.1 cupin domain-containing protein [Edaphobacter sp.]
MHETIRVGELTVTFLKTRHETGNTLEVYEMTLPPTTGAPVPHIHRDYDEIVFVMNGTITWTMNNVVTILHPGDRMVIPRGTAHFFANLDETTARIICLQTPGVMGPEYFREISQHLGTDSPDMAAISEVMNRYGITPI